MTTTILVSEDTNEVCPKCGKLSGDVKIDKLISSNNNINSILFGLTSQIDHIIEDKSNNKQIDKINAQLKNISLVLNHTIEDIRQINEELNKAKKINPKTIQMKLKTKSFVFLINESL